MKKLGFTLAEVLITLGIVGVIAAITLPALMADTTSAQIGPKLAKAVATFEQANEVLLNQNGVDALTDTGLLNNSYAGELSKYLKGSGSNSKFTTKDGMIYKFTIPSTLSPDASKPPHQQRIDEDKKEVMIDINGDSKPNTDGIDRFYFSWWNDGSLRPKGAAYWNGSKFSAEGEEEHWSYNKKCPADAAAEDPTYCAGHIFENNLKVLYK